jgi:F-box protein 11
MHENGKAAVRVWNGGNPLLQRNRIWGGRTVGLLVYEFGRGQYLDNEIHSHASWNVEVGMLIRERGGQVWVYRRGGLLVYEFGRGQYLDNEIQSHVSWNAEVWKDGLIPRG